MKTLVVFFSRSGYTRRVAKQIAMELHADLMPIVENRSRMGVFGYQRCVIEAVLGFGATIRPLPLDPADYELVLLGTPIWAWHLSSPLREFARRHGKSIQRSAFFCTMGGTGAARAFSELEKLLGHAPLATLALTDTEIDDERVGPKIDRFVAALSAPVAR